MSLEILASDLQFPEGPVVFDDGSVIFVEIKRKTLTRYWNGKTEIIAELGGGPNGAALGPDGAMYVCNNGGMAFSDFGGLTIPGHQPPDYSGGRIERVNVSTGKIERLFDHVDGHDLIGPNDLVFDAEGGFYFSDHGKTHPRYRDYGGLFYVPPSMASAHELDHGYTSPNGVGLSPDGKVVYMADTMEGRLYAFDLAGPGQIVPASPFKAARFVGRVDGWTLFDSLAVEADGTIAVATLVNPGFTRFDPATGTARFVATTDIMTTNIAFGGTDMTDAYITLSATGQLAKMKWDAPGLRLNFQA